MDRVKIREHTEALYAARLANDVARCAPLFADGAEFRFATASPALTLPGPMDLKTILTVLVETWKWKEVRDLRVIIEGAEAATHFTLVAEHVPSGKVLTSEIADRIEFGGDYLVTKFVEFADTAEVERALGVT